MGVVFLACSQNTGGITKFYIIRCRISRFLLIFLYPGPQISCILLYLSLMFCIRFMLYFEMTFKLVISDIGKNKLREYLLTILFLLLLLPLGIREKV